MGRWWSIRNSSSLPLLPYHTTTLLQHGLSLQALVASGNNCSIIHPAQTAVDTFSGAWSTSGPCFSCCSDLGAPSTVSFFFKLFLSLSSSFIFSQMFSQGHHQLHWWAQLCPARASAQGSHWPPPPEASSQRGLPCRPCCQYLDVYTQHGCQQRKGVKSSGWY